MPKTSSSRRARWCMRCSGLASSLDVVQRIGVLATEIAVSIRSVVAEHAGNRRDGIPVSSGH
jgi:hypothetical protein